MRLLWLADSLRQAGLNVVEVEGWRSRGSTDWNPAGVVVHHTASPTSTSEVTEARIITFGHSTVPGPIAQVFVARSGTVYVCASGRANHAGTSEVPWAVGGGNRNAVGIEAANNGVGEVWSARMIDTYVTVCAVLAHGLGVSADRVLAHREVARPLGRKIDPRGPWEGGGSWEDMGSFRKLVAERMSTVFTTQEVQPMFQPPHVLAPIVDCLVPPDGRGVWLLGADGGVYAYGGAQFYGSPAGQPYFLGRTAARLLPHPRGGYIVQATSGERYGVGGEFSP